ncbi:serine hydrolase domain-containing protein [Phenylobacterium sp.]|uniref:serine hydrolase domain-containing protein n=1 Tax=Phenylobacterium sp. TaxID=1871053 RepID=UPI0019903CAC|nr:serine hydrolase domain-containing protein [Phenylobacterium sp.]MBC7167010.1 beta-lactamase family protein [Phenylobacterium sp.]
MRRILVVLFVTVVALVAWSGFSFYASMKDWWRPPIAARGDAAGFIDAVREMTAAHEGALAVQLVERGRPAGALYASIGAPVDGDTRFQVASLSKWTTAIGVMSLVEEGRIELDAPVTRYLTRWTLPPSEFPNEQVTIRRVLSHTAGLTDGLAYAGYLPGQPVQSLEESLTQASDADAGVDGRTRAGAEAGAFRYSGGGYTLLQLLIEEVSGESFDAYMRRVVFAPLGMTRSGFLLTPAEEASLAPSFDADGRPAQQRRYTATGAASLYTTTNDLARLIAAHGPGAAPPPLEPQTLAMMREPHAKQLGLPIWGLGVMLYAPNGRGGSIVGHDGTNRPAINTSARVDPATGDGVAVLVTGDDRLASRIAGEWVRWKTGEADIVSFVMAGRRNLIRFGVGVGLILLIAALSLWRPWRRPAT